jgi:hypothetical protein
VARRNWPGEIVTLAGSVPVFNLVAGIVFIATGNWPTTEGEFGRKVNPHDWHPSSQLNERHDARGMPRLPQSGTMAAKGPSRCLNVFNKLSSGTPNPPGHGDMLIDDALMAV